MSLATRLAESRDAQRDSRCIIKRISDQLEPEDKAALQDAINHLVDQRKYKHPNSPNGPRARWIVEALQAEGFNISLGSFNRHVRQECLCESE